VQFVIPAAPRQHARIIQGLARANMIDQDWIHVVEGQSAAALTASDCTLIASGTATLEAALARCPMVIAYKMPLLSWWLTQRKRLQPWVGLPNILAERYVVPELLQEDVTPDRLAAGAMRWLTDAHAHETACAAFRALHETLQMDTAKVASHAIQKVLAS